MTTTIINPPLPLSTAIPCGFSTGKIIRIHGVSIHPFDRFAINLQCGAHSSSDVALHINPRFREHTIVRNSKLAGRWGQEDRHGAQFPFHPAQNFEVLIKADTNRYNIAVNGHHYAEFFFRTAPATVSYLAIQGDVNVSRIVFEDAASAFNPAYVPSPYVPPYVAPVTYVVPTTPSKANRNHGLAGAAIAGAGIAAVLLSHEHGHHKHHHHHHHHHRHGHH